MRPLLRAFEQVTEGTPLLAPDADLLGMLRFRQGDTLVWKVPDNTDPVKLAQYRTTYAMPFQQSSAVVDQSIGTHFQLSPIALTQRISSYVALNSGEHAYPDLDLFYRRVLRIASRYGPIFDGETGVKAEFTEEKPKK